MKKLMIAMTVVLAASVALAAPTKGKKAKAPADGDAAETEASVQDGGVRIEIAPKIGPQAWRQFLSPSIPGATNIGTVYTKPRYWIVLETKYETSAKTMEQLTFTWHVMLDTKTATNKDKESQKKLAPYSYFTTTATYLNIPKGRHAASVCLHPSYLECYGEPKAVGLVVTGKDGAELIAGTVSEINGIEKDSRFWENAKIMEAQNGANGPMVERRQGLLDRSKTIWALVNPNDYELVQ